MPHIRLTEAELHQAIKEYVAKHRGMDATNIQISQTTLPGYTVSVVGTEKDDYDDRGTGCGRNDGPG